MWANFPLDYIMAELAAAGSGISRINLPTCTFKESLSVTVSWERKGFKTLLDCCCGPIHSVSNQQSDAASKPHFDLHVSRYDCFITDSTMIFRHFYHRHTWHMPAVSVNLEQTAIKQLTDALLFFPFCFSTPPKKQHTAVVLSVLWRDLHKAKLLIASLQGARLDNVSHPLFNRKKEGNLRNSSKKDFCLRLISPVEFIKQKKIL